MELKNIHNREKFGRINESSHDGFSNNAKLKDTMIGKLFNGIFKGVGWLYRKTKEFFVINKLNAQLVNELMRGVILFCFANNIDLETGKKLDKNVLKSDIDSSDTDSDADSDTESDDTESISAEQESKQDFKNMRDKVNDICKDKYGFNPVGETFASPLKNANIISYPEYAKDLKEKDYDPNLICIGDKFRIINVNRKIESITISNVDTKGNKVQYYVGDNDRVIEGPISITSLLPVDFNGFSDITKTCEDFLKKNIKEYDSMSDEDKVRLETIYMHYKLIKQLDNASTTASIIKENLNHILNSYEIITEAIAKVGLGDPQAGKIIGPSIALTVKDILTNRDRIRFQHREDLGLLLSDVNLAEIENFVDKKNRADGKTKEIVSSYVNLYNLKTIQISADQLMTPVKNDEGANNALKMRWNKVVSKTNASFSGIMDIESVDITKPDVAPKVIITKAKKAADKLVYDTQNQIDDAKISSKLPLVEDSFANYSSMANKGGWCYYSFKLDGKIYKTAISPIQSKFGDYGLVRVTSAFNDVDLDNHTITRDTNFFDLFFTMNVDEDDIKNGTPVQKNIYFLFKHNQKFPDSNVSKLGSKIIVLNEIVMNNNKSYLFIKMKKGGNLTLNINNLGTLKMSDYIHKIDLVVNNRHFDLSKLDNIWKKSLNFTKLTDFRSGSGNEPSFIVDKNKSNAILLAAKKLENLS